MWEKVAFVAGALAFTGAFLVPQVSGKMILLITLALLALIAISAAVSRR